MGQLILPKQFDIGFSPNSPSGDYELDPNHPLVDEKLLFCQYGMWDMVSRSLATPVSAWGSALSGRNFGGIGGNKFGLQLESHSNTDGGFEFKKTGLMALQGVTDMTVIIGEAIDSQNLSAWSFTCPTSVTAFSAPQVTVGLNTASVSTSYLELAVNIGGSLIVVDADTGIMIKDGSMHVYGASKDNTTTAKFYRDGALYSSNVKASLGGSITATIPNVFLLSRNRSASARGVNGRMSFSAVWAKTLSAGEHALFNADPGALLKPRVPVLYFFAAGTGQTIAIGQAQETDSAFGVTALHSLGIGQAQEVDTAFPIQPRSDIQIGLVSELDTAFPVVITTGKVIGLASEIDSAFAITALQTVLVGQALETDTAFSISAVAALVVDVGLALEQDTAFPITILQLFSSWTEESAASGTWGKEGSVSGSWTQEGVETGTWTKESGT